MERRLAARQDYRRAYRSDPEVRSCFSFLALLFVRKTVNEETHLAGLAMDGNDVLGIRPKVELHLLSSKVQQG